MEGISIHSKVFRSFGGNGYKREPCFLDFQGYNPGIFDTRVRYMLVFVGVFAGMGTGYGGSCLVWGWGLGVFGGYTSICDGGGGGPWDAYTPPSLGVWTRGIRGHMRG